MSLNNEERKAVVTLEIDKASRTFEQIGTLAGNGMWEFVANRLYYTVFHAVLALLINDGHKTSTHRGSVALFGMHYIKTGIFSIDEGKMYSRLQTMRDEADYNCAFVVTKEEIEPYIPQVEAFLKHVRAKLTVLQ